VVSGTVRIKSGSDGSGMVNANEDSSQVGSLSGRIRHIQVRSGKIRRSEMMSGAVRDYGLVGSRIGGAKKRWGQGQMGLRFGGKSIEYCE
jgi:hypothetical protein